MSQTNTKVNIFFEASGGTAPTGWTETFYMPGTNLQANLQIVVNQYIQARTALLGVGSSLQSIRVSNVTPNRQSFIYFTYGKQGSPSLFTSTPADDYDPTQVDLLIRMQDGLNHRRQFWLGGLPDSQTDQLVQQGIVAPFIQSPAFKNWVATVLSIGYQIQYQTAIGPPKTYGYSAITMVQPIMVRKRSRGRPFFLFRGRRLA